MEKETCRISTYAHHKNQGSEAMSVYSTWSLQSNYTIITRPILLEFCFSCPEEHTCLEKKQHGPVAYCLPICKAYLLFCTLPHSCVCSNCAHTHKPPLTFGTTDNTASEEINRFKALKQARDNHRVTKPGVQNSHCMCAKTEMFGASSDCILVHGTLGYIWI